jgi:hypothetical protein
MTGYDFLPLTRSSSEFGSEFERLAPVVPRAVDPRLAPILPPHPAAA